MAELIKAINIGGTQYDIDLSSCVPKCASNKMYPYVLYGNYKECYKVTLPQQGVTNGSTQWYMISMEIILGGTYSQGANGKIFLSYYFKKNSDNTWIAEDVRGIAIGCKLIHNGIYIKYDITNPGIFYIKANNNAYNTISIQNLTANDSAPNYNYSLTAIENINENNIPTSANKTVPITFIDTNDGASIQLSSDLILPQYLKIKAWPGYGNGSADLWYDGNIKRLYYQNATDMQLGSNTVIHQGNIGSQSVNYANSAGSATDQTARTAAATAQATADGKWTYNASTIAGVKVNSASVADSANSVAWDNVTGKPETFPATSHSHSDTFSMAYNNDYVALSFRDEELAKKAGEKYIECWDNAGGWWNWKANKWITVGGTSSNFVKGDGSLDSTVYLPLSGGTLTGNLKWNGSTQEILSFAPADTTWRSGLKYSWSSNTTIGLWGKHSKTQFVWHAGTDFSTTDINGTTTRNYDFQVGRNGSNELEALVGGKKVSLDGHTHDSRYYTETEVNNLLANKSDSGHSHTSFASVVSFAAGLSSAANVTVTGKVSATQGFYEESDSRLKDIEKPLEVDFNDLAKLQKIYFKFKSKPDKTEIGIIAQEVQEIYPEIVSENEDGNLTVAYDKLAVIALAAVDKLNERLERIEKLLSI